MLSKHRNLCVYSVLALLVVLTIACGSTATSTAVISTATPSGSTSASSGSANSEIPTDTSAPAEPAATTPLETYLGDAIQEGGYAITAVTVADPATPGMLFSAVAGKKLIAVEVVISNISGDTLDVNPYNAALLDSDNFLYQPDNGAVDNEINAVSLDPGEQVNGWIAFQIPTKSTAAILKYSFAALGTQGIKANLAKAPAGHQPITVSIVPNVPASKVGDVITQSGYSISISDIKDPATSGALYTPKKGYRLVAVDVTFNNVSGTDTLLVNPLSGYIVDSNGFVYQADLFGVDDEISSANLAVGEKAQGWISFTVPKDAKLSYLKYETGAFSGEYISAGLSK
jgi:Domain of unknown function (DUF4352)